MSDCRYMSDCRSRGSQFRSRSVPTFQEIDHEIISTTILLLSADSRIVVSYKQKYVHKVVVNRLIELDQGKLRLGEQTVPI